jgi:hypothetical protein
MAQMDPQLNKGVLMKLWEEVAQSASSTSVPLVDIHDSLSNKYGKDKSTKSGGVVERAIAKIIERSGGGLKGLQRLVGSSLVRSSSLFLCLSFALSS